MWPRRLSSLTAGSWLAVVVGCGARTTLDQEDYYGAPSPGGSSSGRPSGGSPAGGSTGVAGGGGVAGSPIGGTGVGGTSPVGGTAGVAGDGPGRGYLKQACEEFCGPYSATCPDQAGDVIECTSSCMGDFAGAPRRCRELTLEALDCLSQNFHPELGCDQALLTAVDACFDLVQRVETCSEDDDPPPMPGPSCPASYQSSQFDCTHTLMCPDAYYYVSCYEVEEGESSCVCEDDFNGGTMFIAQVPLQYACDYAMAFCGYPY